MHGVHEISKYARPRLLCSPPVIRLVLTCKLYTGQVSYPLYRVIAMSRIRTSDVEREFHVVINVTSSRPFRWRPTRQRASYAVFRITRETFLCSICRVEMCARWRLHSRSLRKTHPTKPTSARCKLSTVVPVAIVFPWIKWREGESRRWHI